MNHRYLLLFFMSLLFISCSKDEGNNPYGLINSINTEQVVVIDTKAGWYLLSSEHGMIETIDSFPDSLKVDGLRLDIEVRLGKSYFDDPDNSLDKALWFRNFTLAELIKVSSNPDLFNSDSAPFVKVFWSPDYSDSQITYPNGYGYSVESDKNGHAIFQPDFPGVAGFGTFKTELEAFKTGAYILHRLNTDNNLPSMDTYELEFLKVDWY